ncbi:MAG: hypothetical protein AAGE52_20115 [Myxococcota bacterium]
MRPLAMFLLLACSSSGADSRDATVDIATDAAHDEDAAYEEDAAEPFDPIAPLEDAHRCVEDVASFSIAWDDLANPIWTVPDRALKDVSVRHSEGTWHFYYSDIRDDPFRFRAGYATSVDLRSFTELAGWDDGDGVGGVASPDITRHADGYIAVYNSHTRDGDGFPKLYRRAAPSLGELSSAPPTRILADNYDTLANRLIDSALAHTTEGLVLAFKHFQRFEIALAPSGSLGGPWTLLGAPDTEPLENYQFFQLDGAWHLLGTNIPAHDPVLFRRGDDWLSWTEVRTFDVPEEAWNTEERANAAFLCDARDADGFFYLFYAGSTELDRYEGRGHAKIGIARSPDLTTWEVP